MTKKPSSSSSSSSSSSESKSQSTTSTTTKSATAATTATPTPTSKSKELPRDLCGRKVNVRFPLIAVATVGDLVLCGGGGGSAKTGIANALVRKWKQLRHLTHAHQTTPLFVCTHADAFSIQERRHDARTAVATGPGELGEQHRRASDAKNVRDRRRQ